MLQNEYLKNGFGTAENEPSKNCQTVCDFVPRPLLGSTAPVSSAEVTNNYDKPMTWKYLEAQACEKFDMAEDKFGGAFGRAGTMLFSQLPFVGGALPCEAKDGCRNSLRNRFH